MGDVINISDYKNKDDEFISIEDDLGVKWYLFVCSYTDDEGKNVGFDIFARSMEEAEARIEALKRTAVVDGKLCEYVI